MIRNNIYEPLRAVAGTQGGPSRNVGCYTRNELKKGRTRNENRPPDLLQTPHSGLSFVTGLRFRNVNGTGENANVTFSPLKLVTQTNNIVTTSSLAHGRRS